MSDPYYADEFVTLYHGDCREITEWLATDVLVTDPPYGITHEATHGDSRVSLRRSRVRTKAVITGDTSTVLRDTVLELWRPRAAIIFGSWRMKRPDDVHALLIWHKEGAYSAVSSGPFFTNHEEIYAIGSTWAQSNKPLRSVLTTMEHRSQHTAQVGHPTPKPLGLMETLISACPTGAIADPFAGSGSTLIAAKQLGRKAIGVEIDERYCEIAAKRLAQDTLFGGAP